jgi:hypothetical protein
MSRFSLKRSLIIGADIHYFFRSVLMIRLAIATATPAANSTFLVILVLFLGLLIETIQRQNELAIRWSRFVVVNVRLTLEASTEDWTLVLAIEKHFVKQTWQLYLFCLSPFDYLIGQSGRHLF